MLRFTRVHDLDGAPLSVVDSPTCPRAWQRALPRSAGASPCTSCCGSASACVSARSVHTLRVGARDGRRRGLLGVGLADPVLRIQASVYLADGTPIRWTENFFREDRYEYVAEMEWPAPAAADGKRVIVPK